MEGLAPFAWSCRRAVEARLREGLGSIVVGTPRPSGCCWDSAEGGQWRFFCLGERLALEARLLIALGLRVESLAPIGRLVARRLRPGSVGDGDPLKRYAPRRLGIVGILPEVGRRLGFVGISPEVGRRLGFVGILLEVWRRFLVLAKPKQNPEGWGEPILVDPKPPRSRASTARRQDQTKGANDSTWSLQ